MNKLGNIKHGGHGTLTYARWKSMMQRCKNPNASNYRYYGAAGISVCDRWNDFPSFLADMGECPDSSMTLDRINGSIGYQPGNCRWATQADQNRNRPRHAVLLELNGKTQSVTKWATELGIKANTISMRLRLGWCVEQALTKPTMRRGKK